MILTASVRVQAETQWAFEIGVLKAHLQAQERMVQAADDQAADQRRRRSRSFQHRCIRILCLIVIMGISLLLGVIVGISNNNSDHDHEYDNSTQSCTAHTCPIARWQNSSSEKTTRASAFVAPSVVVSDIVRWATHSSCMHVASTLWASSAPQQLYKCMKKNCFQVNRYAGGDNGTVGLIVMMMAAAVTAYYVKQLPLPFGCP
jgi:uncharacterized membrane protein